jgi:hypothetical protein
LPPSHWVVGAPEPPPIAPGSARNTRSHDRCEARCRSPPRHPCAPAPRSITHRARPLRRAVLRSAPGTPGPARRKPNYCDPNPAHRRSGSRKQNSVTSSDISFIGSHRTFLGDLRWDLCRGLCRYSRAVAGCAECAANSARVLVGLRRQNGEVFFFLLPARQRSAPQKTRTRPLAGSVRTRCPRTPGWRSFFAGRFLRRRRDRGAPGSA